MYVKLKLIRKIKYVNTIQNIFIMNCKLIEISDTRRKYVVYPDAEQEGYDGYIISEKYDNYWNIELIEITNQRKGYGTCLLEYVLNDLKNKTKIVWTHPTTNNAVNFFKKHNFKSGFNNNDYLFYYEL